MKFREIIIITVLIAAVLLLLFPRHNNSTDKIIYQYDSVLIYVNRYVPEIDTIYQHSIDSVSYPLPVEVLVYDEIDTLAILPDWLNQRVYTDTLINDGELFMVVEDMVMYNRIISRQFYYKNLRPVSATSSSNRLRFYVGSGYDIIQKHPVVNFKADYRMWKNFDATYQLDILNGSSSIGVQYQLY